MNALKKLLLFLSSPLFSLSVLLAVSVLLIAGVNPWVNKPWDFFRSWGAVSVFTVLCITLCACTLKQAARLLTGRHPIFRASPATWGSVVFHAGLTVICLGIFIEYGFGFTGRVGLVPARLFRDSPNNYYRIQAGPFHRHQEGALALYLHGLKMKYKDIGVFAGADISLVIDGVDVLRREIAAGKPLRYGLWNLYYDSFGYYIKTVVTTGHREIPLDVGLSTSMAANREKYAESFRLENTPYWLDLEFIPNINSPGRTYKPDSPGVRLTVRKAEGAKMDRIYTGVVSLGGSAVFDRAARLKFVGYYPWVMLNAKMEPGLYIIYAGIAVSLTGLALVYLWTPRSN